MRTALAGWIGFFRDNKTALSDSLPDVLLFASTLYLGCSQLLEATTLTNALANWSTKIPATARTENVLAAWQAAPKDRELLMQYLLASITQRHADETAWQRSQGSAWGGDSDDDDAPWGVAAAAPGKKRKPSSSDSSSSDSSNKRRKKAKKEARKQAKKDAKAPKEKDGKDKHRKEILAAGEVPEALPEETPDEKNGEKSDD